MTYATAQVIQALDAGYRYGFDIAEVTGLRGGTVYPILRRLKDAGMVKSEWEPVAISRDEGRPPRKYYRLADGAGEFLAAARERFPLPLAHGQAEEQPG
jgi:DNA-binding PadR family transcriptional regulator